MLAVAGCQLLYEALQYVAARPLVYTYTTTEAWYAEAITCTDANTMIKSVMPTEVKYGNRSCRHLTVIRNMH